MKRTLRALIPTLLLVSTTMSLKAETFDRLAGLVHDKNGKPIAGAKVVLERTDMKWAVQMTTDSKGEFSRAGISPIKAEVYQITITKEGFVSYTQKFGLEVSSDTIHKEFTLSLPGEAPADASGATAPAADPAIKEDVEARAAFNTAIPMYNAKQFAEALPNLEKAYKGMTDAVATMKDEAAKADSAAQLPPMAKAYGLALHQVGKDDEAIAPLSQIVDADPKNLKNGDAMKALVEIYTKKKDSANLAKYQAYLNAAAGVSEAEAPYTAAANAFNAGHMKEAKQHLQQAITADPGYADSYYLLGLVSANEGNLAAAKTNLHKYLELSPNGKKAGEVKELLAGL